MEREIELTDVAAVVTDIEGTTTSLAFVKDVLFPYAAAELPDFVATHGDEPRVERLLGDAARLMDTADTTPEREAIVAQLLQWIAEDRKITPLKQLQGLIWTDGYERGAFCGHVYEDAARVLRAWHDANIALYVYSSGSVEAQKLLFRHSDRGDLTGLFSGYFDTRTGPKKETSSYRAIAESIDEPSERIVFLSDVDAELDAAAAAGLRTVRLVRDGPPPADPGSHPSVPDFDAIVLVGPGGR